MERWSWLLLNLPTQFSTNNSCELQAALHGIEWCHDNSKSHIILEMDSQIAVNMIKGLTPTPWIQNMNCVADALARHATMRDMDYIFSKEEDMPDSTVRPMRIYGQTQSCFI
ncbi:hypothetical protein MTR67_003823 [Solanum verrucosum]|uniref:RNase H type-1 domain-containing protein n=1 Tax=Solanum verrucosum TaxID=315347 RepID=A0AAF0PSX0_SOLVR|nr:hypothetical protein MTR67_003823 [Solanum verrucosum]